MKREFAPARLDVAGFAEAGASLSAEDVLGHFPRLAAEAVEPDGDARVQWTAVGEQRKDSAGGAQPWLHLEAETSVPLVCQRCLLPVQTPLYVDRWFRFAPDEDTAAAQDEESDEDVLVVSRDFDLHALIEDELLMEIPVTPRHDECPEEVPLSAVDPDFDQAEKERPNPFAALAKLRDGKAE
ncbi:DUF177 domain-containing protein [Variovorax sp. J22R133]|uniref:YceD family protein n=1 Tax=Variovorax brevis TaxID=3053503 RepID=UPI00257798F2|nr:DUF177 domain-containing protein [Variovorax sp. J22R133]MDM0114300.1 DUF177 domain-containing protein [Variovorax sp. J22R133]